MGLLTGIVRLVYLKQKQLTLQYKVQQLSTAKMHVSEKAVNLVTIGNDLEPDSPEYKTLEARKQKLHMMEKRMERELTRHRTLLKMVDAEIKSAQKIVDSSIKSQFTY